MCLMHSMINFLLLIRRRRLKDIINTISFISLMIIYIQCLLLLQHKFECHPYAGHNFSSSGYTAVGCTDGAVVAAILRLEPNSWRLSTLSRKKIKD